MMISGSTSVGHQQFSGNTQHLRRSLPTGTLRSRAARTITQDAFVLVPSGDGKSDHLDSPVDAPGMMTLKNGKNQVGRAGPDVTLEIPTVSAKHAEILVEGKKVTVEDLESTNGTFIELEELPQNKPTTLEVGSQVTFGDYSLCTFVLEDQED